MLDVIINYFSIILNGDFLGGNEDWTAEDSPVYDLAWYLRNLLS